MHNWTKRSRLCSECGLTMNRYWELSQAVWEASNRLVELTEYWNETDWSDETEYASLERFAYQDLIMKLDDARVRHAL